MTPPTEPTPDDPGPDSLTGHDERAVERQAADVLAAYRAARDVVPEGEAPRVETRAAILAAAARAVDARPQSVGSDAVVRPSGARSGLRLPLALAASLLVGTVAWQLAAQFDASPPTEQIARAPAAPPPLSLESSAAPPPIAPTAAPRSAPTPSPVAEPLSPPAPARTPSASSLPAPAEPTGAPHLARAVPDENAAPTAASAPSAPPATAETRAAAVAPGTAEATATARSSAPRLAFAEDRSSAARRANGSEASARIGASPAASASAVDSALRRADPPGLGQSSERRGNVADPPPRTAAAWLDRIAELRRDGRDADADAEIRALRLAYPEVQIPPALLLPLPR